MVPSTTKKAPEEVSKPPEKTTVRTATREATQDGVPQPSERITTEAFEGEGSTPENTTADPVRETQKFIDAMDEESVIGFPSSAKANTNRRHSEITLVLTGNA